jgi:hypothetical protein
VCAAIALATGCNRNKGGELDPAIALVEERDDGKLEWNVTPEGQVIVRVTANDGAPPAATGALLVSGQSFPMNGDGTTLSATIPKLAGDLTTISYSLKVHDATWEGALHIPVGGTKELVAVPTVQVPPGTKGPHGGVVDVIGDQRVEVIVDPKTNEVRVYMLDEKLQAVPVGSASAVIGFQQAPPSGNGNGNGAAINNPSPKGL